MKEAIDRREKQVLLVDDDPDFLAQHSHLLERAGYKVFAVESEADAKRLLQERDFDVAVLDLMLEHDDGGFILAQRIKSKVQIPVIIVTAVTSETGMSFDTSGDSERTWMGADAVLSKPIRFEQLTRELNRLLRD